MTKNEIIFTVSVMAVIGLAGGYNLSQSKVLARDIQRKNDLKHIATGLADYRKDVGVYPQALDGKIAACGDPIGTKGCEWAVDKLESTQSAYLTPLPEDPLSPPKAIEYYYVSNGRDFQIFASLERRTDAEFNKGVEARNLQCGSKICNFGVSSDVSSPPDGPLNSGEPK